MYEVVIDSKGIVRWYGEKTKYGEIKYWIAHKRYNKEQFDNFINSQSSFKNRTYKLISL